MATETAARVAILMGSDSDLGVMLDAARVLKQLDLAWEINALSAHRTPHQVPYSIRMACDVLAQVLAVVACLTVVAVDRGRARVPDARQSPQAHHSITPKSG